VRRPELPAAAADVPIQCSKSHATIWGKTVKHLKDIPSQDARQVLDEIAMVPGITRIILGPFGRTDSRASCLAWVGWSNTPFVIAGKLYDDGSKGTLQQFQVRVQFDSQKKAVLQGITDRLQIAHRWTGKLSSRH